MLTRTQMEEVIRQGGSVLHKGVVISTADALPTESALALESGDVGEVDRVKADKQAEIDKLKAEIDVLKRAVDLKPEPKAEKQAGIDLKPEPKK